MSALGLGIIAALCWGIHDVCVRYISQRINIFTALFLVVLTGTLLLVPLSFVLSDGAAPSGRGTGYAIASGIAFAFAGIGLYKAFSYGPVRLVAPIIGAYPVISMAWATVNGAPTTVFHWLAVLAVIAGIAIVAGNAKGEAEEDVPRSIVIAWSLFANFGWATTFILGQIASEADNPFDILLVTRMATVCLLIPILWITGSGLGVDRRSLGFLCILGLLDATALGMILQAGALPSPEYAAVAASTFGMVTILLAWLFLREPMTLFQWTGVIIVFAGIGYLAV